MTYQSGGALPANGGCSIQVDVTSSTVRSYVNTIAVGAVQTTVGNNTVAASATLQVLALPTVAKAFVPGLDPAGRELVAHADARQHERGRADPRVRLRRRAAGESRPRHSGDRRRARAPSANVVAAAGGPTVTYKSGASIPAGGCTITVPVTTALAGGYDNVIAAGALVTTIGSNPAGASAHLDVLQADLSITKTDGVADGRAGHDDDVHDRRHERGTERRRERARGGLLPAAITSATWTCVASAGSSCGAASGSREHRDDGLAPRGRHGDVHASSRTSRPRRRARS